MITQEFIRVLTIDPHDLFPLVCSRREKREHDFEGFLVKMYSDRYSLFKTQGTICVSCGIVGVFFALERQRYATSKGCMPNRFHFNLYGYDENGQEIMFTKDHIVPKSKGGKNSRDNYQVMCSPCNFAKDDN